MMREWLRDAFWFVYGCIFLVSCIAPAGLIALAAIIGGHMERKDAPAS